MCRFCLMMILILSSFYLKAQSYAVAQNNKRPEEKQKEDIQKEIDRYGGKYDTTACLVWSMASPHYHSDFQRRTKVHSTRPSLNYAVALLNADIPAYHQRAFDILRAVLALQDQDQGSKTFGVWPYYLEEPLSSKKSPADLNWADFCALPLLSIINNHHDILPPELREKIRHALLLASEAIRHRDVKPDYTNISIMGLYVCYMTSHIFNDAELMAYARNRLKAFYDFTRQNKGFTEYNSPPYFKVSLDAVLLLLHHVTDREDHAMLEYIYHTGWEVIARHYHTPTAQWSGPHGRCYSELLQPSARQWLYCASGGKIDPDTPDRFPKYADPALDHKIPADLMHFFTHPVFPRMEIDTFIRGGQEIELNPLVSYQESDRGVVVRTNEVIGKSYLTNDYALSSASRSCLWNQRHPLIAYWGTIQKPVAMRLRFLHDNYDYAAANIFCSQDSNHVLGAVNFTTNGGDRHVTIDLIQNGIIKASDLRLRLEFAGDTGSLNIGPVDEKHHTVTGTSGKVAFRLQIPYFKFGEQKMKWIAGGDNKTRWIDLVIYSGPEQEFNFEKMKQAIIGFMLSVSDSGEKPILPVKVSNNKGNLRMQWENLSVEAMVKPYSERTTLILK